MSRFATPPDLTHAPWWPRARTLTFEQVYALIGRVEPLAMQTVFDDYIDLQQLTQRITERQARNKLDNATLGSWVAAWRPLKHLVAGQRLAQLRSALAALGGALDKEFDSAPVADALGPIGAMDVRVLSARRQQCGLEIPGLNPYLTGAWGQPQTVSAHLDSPWVRGTELRAWCTTTAKELSAALAREAPARAQQLAAWRAAAPGPVTAGLLGLQEGLAKTETPIDDALRAATVLSWDALSDEIAATVPGPSGLFACLSGPCQRATVAVGGEQPTAHCDQGAKPCRMKLAAVERVLDALTGRLPGEGAESLRVHFQGPSWERMLKRLRASATTMPVEQGHLGWLLKSRDELAIAWFTPKKSGVGMKVNAISRAEVDRLDLEHPADAIALTLVKAAFQQRSGDHSDYLAQALAALVGSDRVYTRFERDLVRLRIEVVEPRVEVVQGADGPRVVVRLGDLALDPQIQPRPGNWTVAVDEAAGRVQIGFWSRGAHRAWLALRSSGDAVLPTESASALAETLLAIAPHVAVKKDASWLGEAHPPASDIVFRLGLEGPRGAKVLTVEACAEPVPELGPLPPGAGEEVIALRRDGRVGHVQRAFDRECQSVAAIARDVGLAVNDDGPFTWRIEGLEAAVQIWSALTASASGSAEARPVPAPLRVEWRTKEPKVQRNRRIDKLRLKLGLKKDWLDVRGGFQLDGGELPLAELLQALRDKKRFVQLDDERVLELGAALTKELAPLEALMRASEDKDGGLRASMFAAPLIAELESLGATVEGPPEWLLASKRLAEAATLEVEVPAGLKAELRPYQYDGLVWAARLAHWARGACLADEMGLGKTLQALALLLRRRGLGRALVIAPTSVVPNWLRETARFTPRLPIAAIARGTALDALDGNAAVIVTSWDLVVRHEERFAAITWGTVVLDEAHAMKNASTRRAQVAKNLPADFVLALTGTPVENRPSELWSLFQAVAPGLLGSAEGFRDSYARAIEGGDGDAVRRLARLVRPFILRRKKSEVASDLPAITEVRVDVVLPADERERYERVRKSALAELAKDAVQLGEKPGGKHILRVLVVLTRLRQLACHPRLVDPKAGPSSAKLDRLLELMTELRDEGRKVLVFSQFTELLALVRTAFDAAGLTYAYLDGSTPAERRIAEVDRFQGGTVDAFLLSLKAGGVGLNLTAASEVIHLDPWWNPAVEDQATGRAHRIGQDKPVTVYRLVAQGTIEEQILGLHGDKRAMVASLLEGTGSAMSVTVAELMALLSEEGLEASAPDAAPEARDVTQPLEAPAAITPRVRKKIAIDGPAVQASPSKGRPAPAPPSPTTPLERAIAELRKASGAPLKRADLVSTATISDIEWGAVRAALEADSRIGASGVTRGRGYRWVGTTH